MEIGIALVFVVVFLISLVFITWPRNLPPGPLPLPFVGCVSILRSVKKKRPHEVFHDLGNRYGPVYSFKIGSRLVVVLHGYDAIRDALVKQSEVFSDRPTYIPSIKAFVAEGGGVLFNNYNHDWKILRRFTLQALRDFGVGKSSLEEKIEEEIKATSKWFKQNADKPVDMNERMQTLVGNILFGIVFGRRYEYDDPEFKEIRLMTSSAVSGDGFISAVNFLPGFVVKILKTFSNQRSFDDIRRVSNQMNAFLIQKVDEHEATFDENNIRDFIDLHIKTTRDHEGEERSEFSRGNLLRVITDLFLAGTETTATSLDWAFLYMSEFPNIQKKCQAEIEEVVGDKYIQYSDRENLPYMNATLMEIQRLTVIAPLAVIHNTIRETTLRGYNIPRGTLVIPNLYSSTRDPKYWPDPEKFNPERFLDKSGKLLKPDAFIPFSTGGNLLRVITDLFLAGTETTATSLDWAFLYMSEFPNIQKKCQAEIEEVVGDKYIQYSDRENLPYMNATLMEIQRLTVIAPLAVIHNTIRETTLRGYNIPRGTLVIPNLYSSTRDPKYWPDPEKFNPERFLDKSGKLLKPDAFIPFSTGPRQCLGEPLARMELFLVFANLIQRFNFRRENEAVKHSLQSRRFKITNIAMPYKVLIESRS